MLLAFGGAAKLCFDVDLKIRLRDLLKRVAPADVAASLCGDRSERGMTLREEVNRTIC